MTLNIKCNKQKISPEEKIQVLAFSRISGVGPFKFKNLFKKFKSIENIFNSDLGELFQIVTPSIAKEIKSKRCLVEIDEYLRVLQKSGVSFITILDEEYPDLLKEIHDPPIILYYKGNFQEEDFNKCFAVVGTRNCTRYGAEVVDKLVESLVEAGFNIVSGMAFGIDKIAHEVAIRANGRTIGVLSGRVDMPSPRSNSAIYNKILDNGFVISENHLDLEITSGMFPSRNRIISGLSFGTLIIEAGEKSGALITARLALEQGREVFAVPANIYTEKGKGTNKLIQKGEAKLVQKIDDILEEFGFKISKENRKEKERYSPMERKVIDFLIKGPASIDEIAENVDIDIANLLQIIAIMEIDKKLAKTDGDLYVILR